MPIPRGRPRNIWSTAFPSRWRGEIKGDEIELLGEPARASTSNCSTSAAARSANMAARAATTFPATRTSSRSAPAWPTGAARGPTSWPSSRSRSTSSRHGHGRRKARASKADDGRVHDAAYVGPHSDEGIGDEVELAHAEGRPRTRTSTISMPTIGYFMEKLFGHEREGFVWQKLRARAATTTRRPKTRATTSGCGCRSSISTPTSASRSSRSCSGLVAEPPAPAIRLQADIRAAARSSKARRSSTSSTARAATPSRWTAGTWPTRRAISPIRPSSTTTPSSKPHFTPQQIKASLKTDNSGLRHAALIGMPDLRREDRPARARRRGRQPDRCRRHDHPGVRASSCSGKRADQRQGAAGGLAKPDGADVARGRSSTRRRQQLRPTRPALAAICRG